MKFSRNETAVYAGMQARLIELLVRHDQAGFRRFIDQRSDVQGERDGLERYRELGVLFFLRDELFEHILPRIVRRLSFESPRNLAIEEPPPRGRVDWERTLAATWAERPGEPPLQLHTRQRRREFATPANLLAVATLLEYRQDVLGLLWEGAFVDAASLRHPINEIAERCERELAFPQFAGLRSQAQRIIDEGATEALEAEVRDDLPPGGNSAYEELLTWRERRRSLRLLDRDAGLADDVLGADPKRDNYLYQLWIFYELADFLQTQTIDDAPSLIRISTKDGEMRLRFRWGAAATYELRHDLAVPSPVARWSNSIKPRDVPGVRPDFYLRRVDPKPHKIHHNGTQYWREPGIVWDAKYYRERQFHNDRTPSTPVKRMIADLDLLGEQYGTLLFAFTPESQKSKSADHQHSAPVTGQDHPLDPEQVEPTNKLVGILTPIAGQDQPLNPEQQVDIRRLSPATSAHELHTTFVELLDIVDERLREEIIPRCYGMFLDDVGVNRSLPLFDRYNKPLAGPSSELLICPKPHIGPWRVDLVSRQTHCCEDPTICQIIGQKGARKPTRPVRTAEELLKELQQIFATAKQSLDDDAIQVMVEQVQQISRQFFELSGGRHRIDRYYQLLRDLGMDATLDLLGKAEQESLAISLFLVERLDEIKASDYSAPAIHISSVLELEVKRRIFKCPGLQSEIADTRKQTLGKLPFMRIAPHRFYGDWQRIVAYARGHWQEGFDPGDPGKRVAFEAFIQSLDELAKLRNKAAHTDPVSRTEYGTLQKSSYQSGLGYGVLNILLLAWK